MRCRPASPPARQPSSLSLSLFCARSCKADFAERLIKQPLALFPSFSLSLAAAARALLLPLLLLHMQRTILYTGCAGDIERRRMRKVKEKSEDERAS
jgi:hypothetical protein